MDVEANMSNVSLPFQIKPIHYSRTIVDPSLYVRNNNTIQIVWVQLQETFMPLCSNAKIW